MNPEKNPRENPKRNSRMTLWQKPGVVLDAAMDEIRGRFSRKNLGNFSCIISELNMERILKVPLGKIPVKVFTELLTKI